MQLCLPMEPLVSPNVIILRTVPTTVIKDIFSPVCDYAGIVGLNKSY